MKKINRSPIAFPSQGDEAEASGVEGATGGRHGERAGANRRHGNNKSMANGCKAGANGRHREDDETRSIAEKYSCREV